MKNIIEVNGYEIEVNTPIDSILILVKKDGDIIHQIYQEENSTFIHNNEEYNLNKLLLYSKDLPVKNLSIDKLKWIIPYTTVDKNRVESSDTNIPILITKWNNKWVVLDGIHRLVKSKNQDKKSIRVKIISTQFLKSIKI
jgi:hypothetical protein